MPPLGGSHTPMLGVYVWVAQGTWARGPTDLGENQSHSLLAPFPTRYAPARPHLIHSVPNVGSGSPLGGSELPGAPP